MLKVGITGGIGSGKTIVCRIFGLLGIPVFSADIQAKVLMDTEPEIKNKLTKRFGNNIYNNGVLNRPLLASVIFCNENELTFVNSLIHPLVRESFKEWCTQYKDCDYVLHEAAILFESGLYKDLDRIILIDAPEDTRIQRVIKRDGTNPESVKARIRKQMPAEQKKEMSDYIINNDGNKLIIPEILHIDSLLKTIR